MVTYTYTNRHTTEVTCMYMYMYYSACQLPVPRFLGRAEYVAAVSTETHVIRIMYIPEFSSYLQRITVLINLHMPIPMYTYTVYIQLTGGLFAA